jgi:DNA helicase II / ATP-dependent DNA helicase PcrA
MAASRIALAAPTEPSEAEPELLQRAEVRDVLAWLRLLLDPHDAAAIVRALSRPPIELRQVELARVIQIARRRKLGLVRGLLAATESPHVPPEARERLHRFLALHAAAAAELDAPADVFLAALIERLRPPARALLGSTDAAAGEESLRRLRSLARQFARSTPGAPTRELLRYLTTAAASSREGKSAPAAPPANAAPRLDTPDLDGRAHRDGEAGLDERSAGLDERATERELQEAFQALRAELLDGVARIGGRLGELRLDTDLDISHGVARYLELLKLSAVLQRPAGQSLADALAALNAPLLAAATPLQREILQTSTLDDALTRAAGRPSGEEGTRERLTATLAREQHSLTPFLPRKGAGLALSASDIHTYRSCPLRYKYARVLRIPTAQTVHQRFGIVVHQVLERYHCDGGSTLRQLLAQLDSSWRRAGFGDDGLDRELYDKALAALTRYHARLRSQPHARRDPQPVWFERQFSFQVGPHHLRGRVDRVDRLSRADGRGTTDEHDEYELIDYKTSRPKSPEQAREDIQLSLYALAAREDWGLRRTRQSYYYVLDDLVVPVARDAHDLDSVQHLVMEVGDGILAERFQPTPSAGACARCDYRITCPAAAA